MLIEQSDFQVKPTDAAFVNVGSPSAGHRVHRRLFSANDPAAKTRGIAPDLDQRLERALRRAARNIALRLLLRQPLIEIEYLLLKGRYSLLRLRRHFTGSLFQRFFQGH